MIEIISHRGICDSDESTLLGIKNCVDFGFGIELDIRINEKSLYVSHDVSKNGTSFLEICEILKNSSIRKIFHLKETEALDKLLQTIDKYKISNFFLLSTKNNNLNTKNEFNTVAYFNKFPTFIDSKILWCDETGEKWFDKKIISTLQNHGNLFFAHSLELIQNCSMNEIKNEWDRLFDFHIDGICTNFPKECREYLEEMEK